MSSNVVVHRATPSRLLWGVLGQALAGAITFTVSLTESFAEAANTYPGVILSHRSTSEKEASLEAAATSLRFAGLSSERLRSGSVHVREKALSAAEEGPVAGRRNLCRTARVRRIMSQAQGHVNCSKNYELTISKVPNDPGYSSYMWGPQMMAAPAAWDVTTGTRDAIVAVVDTGLSHSHIDLRDNLWVNPRETPLNGRDDDVNGFVDDVYGANAINRMGSGSDDNSHGSHVAGTIGATGDNAEGVVGLNWNVRLMSVKFLSASGSGSTADAIRAIQYVVTAKQNGHNVVAMNNSWGGPSYSRPLLDAILSAGSAGILFVAAAGNSSRNNDVSPSYPASYSADNIISVASVDSTGALSYFSNYGPNSVHIAAPGSGIYSTTLNWNYGTMSGTSMACPHVAGLAALAYAACPGMTMKQLKGVVLSNGLKKSSLTGKISTGSIANAAGTVLTAQLLCPSTTPSPTSTPDPNAPTPLPTSTPTTTPTPTITPTPTATPLPTGGYLIAEPSVIASGSPLTLKISVGKTTSSSIALKWLVDDLYGTSYACQGATIVSLPKGSRTVQISLPAEAKYFPYISVSFETLKAKFSTKVIQTGTQRTLTPNVQAYRLCQGLVSKPIL